MTLKDAINNLRTAPNKTLILLLLKQFKTLLEERGIELDTQSMQAIAQQAANRETLPEKAEQVKAALVHIVEESITLLQERFNLTFAKSLVFDGNLLTGWRTPAEFQEMVAEKNNAEVRIGMGAALLALLGDSRYITFLFITMEHEYVRGHMEAMLAMRALSYAAEIDPSTEDWERKVREALLPPE